MDNSKFCPIVKEVCKDDICMAWQGGNCSILTFFKSDRLTDNGSNQFLFSHSNRSREQILADEVKVEQLLPDCLEWARSKKITRPTREEIKIFLTVNNITLSYPAMRLLWQQAKVKLREWKMETQQLVSEQWRANPSNIGMAWSTDEDEALLKEFDLGNKLLDLARLHKRTIHAIELRLEKFGKIQLAK